MPTAQSVTLPRVNRGDPITAELFNKFAEEIERATRISLTGCNWHRNMNGLHIAIPPIPQVKVFRLEARLVYGETADAIHQTWDGSDWTDATTQTTTLNCDFKLDYYWDDSIVLAHHIAGKWQVISDGAPEVRCTLDEAASAGTDSTASVQREVSGTWTDTGDNLETDVWATVPSPIATSTVVRVQQMDFGLWYIVGEICES